jgi:hypothetical protein
MSELALIVLFLSILFGSQLLISRIKKPLLFHIRICSAIVLLVLVWLFGRDSNIGAKIILSIIAVTSLCNGVLSIKNFKSSYTNQQTDNKK